jgi:hypothetical protein
MYGQIVHLDDAGARGRVYHVGMRRRANRADVVATIVVATLAGSVGTGLGLAAAHVRSEDGSRSGPLRIILRGGNDIPSLQRDRVRLRHSR